MANRARPSVLIAYASKYGSTQEVAKGVGAWFEQAGASVDVWPQRKVTDLPSYDAVVVGAPFYFARLHRHTRRFLKRQREVLSRMPVAIFALTSTPDNDLNGSRFNRSWAHERLERSIAKYLSQKPVCVALFGGAIDPARLRFPDSINPNVKNTQFDFRDWEAIGSWALDCAGRLQPKA
jgi:menaquinone-dependent protoporphyrinogen oxidase